MNSGFNSGLVRIEQGDTTYPSILIERFGETAPQFIDAIGNLNILQNHKVALFCSVRCPTEKIIAAQDLAHRLRDEGITVISGFHSPVEKECLRVLLKGTQPIIICPARGLEGMRIPKDWKIGLAQQRILLLSLFSTADHRLTASNAETRNRFVGQISDEVIFIHAVASSKTARLLDEMRFSKRQ